MNGATALRAHGVQRQDAAAADPSITSLDKKILSIPARIARPRIIFMLTVAALCSLGLLMVYSASSIKALNSFGDASYYLVRQALFIGIGVAGAWFINRVGFDNFSGDFVYVVWGFTIVALLATKVYGFASHGATRWIPIGPIQFQPSEFAKPAVVLIAATLLDELANLDGPNSHTVMARIMSLAPRIALGVVLPLGLIIIQPDKGTTLILVITLVVMTYLSGLFKGWQIGLVAVFGAIAFLIFSLRDDYSRQRFLTMLDPWKDPFNTGYQLTQGFMAFGLGHVTGVGVGMSTQKYSYLPEAHNDFIFAIIGEELGFFGTVAVVLAFALLMWSGYEIAANATTAKGRLVAAGCSTLLVVQFLVNVLGVLGVMPLTGKPIPFLSYGGSAMIAFLADAGMVVAVSRATSLPETEYERTRRQMHEVRGGGTAQYRPVQRERAAGYSTASSMSIVGQGYERPDSRSKLRMVGDNGPSSRESSRGELRLSSRSSGPEGQSVEGVPGARVRRTGGRDRIELGRTPYERLRQARSSEDYDGGSGGSGSRTRR